MKSVNVKNLSEAKTEVATVLKKYRVSWLELNSNNALLAWRSLGNIWKDKKIPDALAWQRKIRKEWDRKF